MSNRTSIKYSNLSGSNSQIKKESIDTHLKTKMDMAKPI
jgi:hypothetical protein